MPSPELLPLFPEFRGFDLGITSQANQEPEVFLGRFDFPG